MSPLRTRGNRPGRTDNVTVSILPFCVGCPSDSQLDYPTLTNGKRFSLSYVFTRPGRRVKCADFRPQMLSHAKLSPDFSIQTLARRTDGLSGSDLRETCRNAAMMPVQELMRSSGKTGKEGLELARKEVRPNARVMVRCS